jgi:hypothetical protein
MYSTLNNTVKVITEAYLEVIIDSGVYYSATSMLEFEPRSTDPLTDCSSPGPKVSCQIITRKYNDEIRRNDLCMTRNASLCFGIPFPSILNPV